MNTICFSLIWCKFYLLNKMFNFNDWHKIVRFQHTFSVMDLIIRIVRILFDFQTSKYFEIKAYIISTILSTIGHTIYHFLEIYCNNYLLCKNKFSSLRDFFLFQVVKRHLKWVLKHMYLSSKLLCNLPDSFKTKQSFTGGSSKRQGIIIYFSCLHCNTDN